MIIAWTAKSRRKHGNTIQRDVWQHADFAIDLATGIHVQPRKDSEKSHAHTTISHSPIWTASITTSSSKCPDSSAISRVLVKNVTHCKLCWKVVFARDTGPRRHKCSEPMPNDEICERCGGLHRWNMPCYIQPVSVEKLNSLLQKRRRPIKNPNSIDITETDDETDEDSDEDASISTAKTPKVKPYRYFIFDIECAQENEVQPGRFKHEALLVCAELIVY